MFPFLKPSDVDEFLAICQFQSFKSKEIIIKEGDSGRRIMFILSGFIRGYVRDADGVEKNLTLRGHGKFSSTPEWLFADVPTRYGFEALMETDILFFNLPDFEDLAKRNSSIFDLYSVALKENLAIIGYRLESMILLSPEERYKDLLAKYPGLFQAAFNKHIANFLGITPVSLSRLIKRTQQKAPKKP